MTFLSDWGFWKELASMAYSIVFCLLGVGCGVTGLAFLIALVCVLIDWMRKERHES